MRAFTVDAEERTGEIFKRVAFVCRYGHTGYFDAMEIPIDELRSFCEALAGILKEENRPLERGGSR